MQFARITSPSPGGRGNSQLAFADTEIPAPTARQVLVRMRAASLNRRDLMVADNVPDGGLVPLSDGAGDVVAIGTDVTRVSVGDRVATTFFQSWIDGLVTTADLSNTLGGPRDGVLAEYCAVDEEGLVRIPDALSFEEAATLPCAGVTAWNALFGGQPLRLGQVVLVMGGGGVSLFALQLARAAGAAVIAISSKDATLDRMRTLGASETINYHAHPDWHELVMQLTAKRGVDHVIDIGGAMTLPKSIAAVAIGGSVAVVGVMSFGGVELSPLIAKSAVVRGVAVGSRAMFESLLQTVASSNLRPVIDQRLDWRWAADAYALMRSSQHFGKIVLTF